MSKVLVLFLKFLSICPFMLLRVVAIKLYYFNAYIFKYRYDVVDSNLKLAFPKKSEIVIKQIRKFFFKHFFNLIMEIIKMLTASKSFINNRVTITNPELIDNFAKDNQTIIIVFGHFNNWEWIGQKLSIIAKQKVVGIYKPLNNKVFNELLKTARTKFGAIAVSMEESMRYILKTKDDCQIIGIIADQNPVVNETTKWLSFFKKEVPVFMGAERIAKKMNYPVVFCDMQKISNGKYNITFEVLEGTPKNTTESEITKCYFERLEQQIKANPSQWLWSHRRWKHKR
ncbi:MAG: lysophospholipid acyltransferase family protein [Flavobacteriales bacterium]|nr:lysophospholipid acyltransferase family protein [Flavobacteriales bacterium]